MKGDKLSRQNTGWMKKEVKTLERLVAQGKSWSNIASTLQRSANACKLRHGMVRFSRFYHAAGDDCNMRVFYKKSTPMKKKKKK
jgi:hypothetical protein